VTDGSILFYASITVLAPFPQMCFKNFTFPTRFGYASYSPSFDPSEYGHLCEIQMAADDFFSQVLLVYYNLYVIDAILLQQDTAMLVHDARVSCINKNNTFPCIVFDRTFSFGKNKLSLFYNDGLSQRIRSSLPYIIDPFVG
jgi:hypothetical protein